MSARTKISIDANELKGIQDPSPFLVRRAVIPKLTALLAQWMETVKSLPAYQNFPFPAQMDTTVGNITRGEQLQGCPYLIADLPRLFHPKGHFVFRTLFWWGHGFTFFWHISGAWLQPFGFRLLRQPDILPASALLSVSGDEWSHVVESDNYRDINDGDVDFHSQLARENGFVKIAMPCPLDKWEQLEQSGLSLLLPTLRVMAG